MTTAPSIDNDAATRYARLVVDDKIIAGELVKLACQRHLDDLATGAGRGLHYDPLEAAKAVHFYGLLPHIKGEWARRNERLHIELWQAFTIAPLYAWKRDDGLRRFRTVYEEVARKNAKTTKQAGTGLRLAFFDGEPGAEVYAAATKLDQAKIVWSDARGMVQKSPGLRRRIDAFALSLARTEQSQVFRPLGSDRNTLDGLNAHGNIVDELHAHPSRDLWDVLETATGARQQPLTVAITTAGYDRQSICWEQRSYGEDVLRGTIKDDAFFAYIATLDKGDDPFDPAVWPKANPNLIGTPYLDKGSVYPDYISSMARRAREVPGRLNAFLRLHLNVWTEQAQRWIDVAAWDVTARRPVDPAALRGRPCFLGVDLASTTDIAAYVLLFPPAWGDPDWSVILRCFAPAQHPAARSKQERERYEQWAAAGLLTLTPGNVTDYRAIRHAFNADAQLYDVQEVAYDPWNATSLITELQEDGATCVPVRQGFAGHSAACKRLEELILGQQIRDGGNPIMRYMIGNTSVIQDPAGNLKPAKDRSGSKIDGVVAMLNALARAMLYSDKSGELPNVWVFDDDLEGYE